MKIKKLKKEFEKLFILTSIYEDIISKKVPSYKEAKLGSIKLSLLKKQILNKTTQIKEEIEEMKKQNVKGN